MYFVSNHLPTVDLKGLFKIDKSALSGLFKNKFHFSDIHRSMNAMGRVQSE